MEAIAKKRVEKETLKERSQRRLREGKPLSATSMYWLSLESCDAISKSDMRAILR